MIARVWTGVVRREDADEYVGLMRTVALPDYRRIPGNRGAWCLRRDGEVDTTIQTLTFWDDLAAIRRFAGDRPEQAKYYDFDARFLLDAPETVVHYDVAA